VIPKRLYSLASYAVTNPPNEHYSSLEQGHTVVAAVKFVSYLRVSTDKQDAVASGWKPSVKLCPSISRVANGSW